MTFDPETYAAGIRRENEGEVARIQERLRAARAEAERLAREIRAADPRIRRVILFGSVARGDPFREDFDLDLALEGGDLDLAMDVVAASAFDVDLVSLELLSGTMRSVLLAGGIELA